MVTGNPLILRNVFISVRLSPGWSGSEGYNSNSNNNSNNWINLTPCFLDLRVQVNDTNGMDAVVGLIDSRLNLIVKAHSSQLGLNESLCGDGTVDPSDTTVPGSETSVSTVDVVFNTTTSTTTTTYTTTTVIPSGASFGTAGGSMFLNQTFLSSDPTSGLFLPTSPGTVEMFIRPYQSQGVLYSYGYDSTFSIFLNDTLQVQGPLTRFSARILCSLT